MVLIMESYVNKNQYGYAILGLIVDKQEKVITVYSPCMMPIGKHKKKSKKVIREMIETYSNCGYKVINK